MGDAIAICFPVVSVGNEEVMNHTEGVEGYGITKWHGGAEVDGTMEKGVGDVCGRRSW